MQIEIGTLLRIPRGTPDTTPLEFELKDIILAEKRKNEVAYVNSGTAPELMAFFNDMYCDVKKMMNQINFEYTQAEKAANRRKAIVILDVVPRVLQEKGLASARSPGGSEDLRNAVLELDAEYSILTDKVSALEAAYEFLGIKAKGFEMAYHSVKKTLGNEYRLGNNANNLSVNTADTDNLDIETPLIGKPRY